MTCSSWLALPPGSCFLFLLHSHRRYGIARRIEQTSGDALSLNYGMLYPTLLKLEQEGSIAAE
jgi:DNA-binding PadR family transcriptional regulator